MAGEMKSGAGDVLPIPGRRDSWAPLTLWGSGCSSEDPNGLNVPSSLDEMLRGYWRGKWLRAQRNMSVVQIGAPCYRNSQQRVFLPLAVVV